MSFLVKLAAVSVAVGVGGLASLSQIRGPAEAPALASLTAMFASGPAVTAKGGPVDQSFTVRRVRLDDLVAQENVVEAALAWLTGIAKLPQGPMLATRAIARADIIEALNSFNTVEMEVFMQGWYSEETQSVLHGLFAKK